MNRHAPPFRRRPPGHGYGHAVAGTAGWLFPTGLMAALALCLATAMRLAVGGHPLRPMPAAAALLTLAGFSFVAWRDAEGGRGIAPQAD